MIKTDWKPLLDLTSRLAREYLESLADRPIRARATPEQMLAAFDGPVPETGLSALKVVEELARGADPGLAAMPSGRFFGWVIGGSHPAALAADWLTVAWEQNTGMAEPTPAASMVEQVALRWLTELLGLPAHCSGALVTGAQVANTVCLTAARHAVLAAHDWDVEVDGLQGAPKISVLVSQEQHDTVAKSIRHIGLGTRSTVAVDTDEQGRMRAGALAQLLEETRGPTIVCAQAGNVNTGAIDPMSEICDVVDRHRDQRSGTWLHVDGAFGLWAQASADKRALSRGIERADSWATDAHKWLNTPYDCGIAFTAHPEAHRASMSIRAAYLPEGADEGYRNPVDWTPELSRRARGFAVYAAIRELGRQGVEELVDRCCRMASRFADRLNDAPGVSVVNDVVLNQVLVRFSDGGDDDAHTRRVVTRVQREGTCFMSATTWHGMDLMRISVSNWSTDESDVDRSLESILRAHAERV